MKKQILIDLLYREIESLRGHWDNKSLNRTVRIYKAVTWMENKKKA